MQSLTQTRYDITPVAKPRMTRKDKWDKRPATTKYWQFCKEVKKLGITVYDDDHIIFNIPMPKSWSKKKRDQMRGRLHKQKPDIDNLCKALLDAVFDDDAHISILLIEKRWSDAGSIQIIR